MNKLVTEIQRFLTANALWSDVSIYHNGQKTNLNRGKIQTITADVSKYIEGINKNDTIIIFEGALYSIINYNANPKLLKQFDSIFKKHNTYYEQHNAWNLKVYKM